MNDTNDFFSGSLKLPKKCGINVNILRNKDEGLWKCFLEVDSENQNIVYSFSQNIKVKGSKGDKRRSFNKQRYLVGRKESHPLLHTLHIFGYDLCILYNVKQIGAAQWFETLCWTEFRALSKLSLLSSKHD